MIGSSGSYLPIDQFSKVGRVRTYLSTAESFFFERNYLVRKDAAFLFVGILFLILG